METPRGVDAFSGSKHDQDSYYVDDFDFDLWDAPTDMICTSQPRCSKQVSFKSTDSSVSDGYISGENHGKLQKTRTHTEVNLKNVLGGIVEILTGKNKGGSDVQLVQGSTPGTLFLGYEDNGGSFLHPSVYIPSAPPLLEAEAIDCNAYRAVLEADPPEWLPDSHSSICMQCASPFTAITRGRHHCRFCGQIFCRACTKGRCLLPVKFRERDPQRVCDACYDRLDPLQALLINSISNAMQVAKHDVVDWTCARGWFNLPVGLSMEHEIYKATSTLNNYSQVARSNPERSIPMAVIKGAKGLTILTVVRVGALLTYKLGTGLVIGKRSDGSWSAPSSIMSVGLGWGAQIGGELTDYIIVLHGSKAVKTFCSRMHFSLGAGLSCAAGPIGRVLEADLRAGDKGTGMCYTYSCSKGAFVGVSLEGNLVVSRTDANTRFYGDPYLTTTDILLGTVESPKAALPLYAAVNDLCSAIHC
ncbi:hypothetical protein Cni_G00766 [Canna indica]|uniref:FYVE-type domain-containing protein n=1 Tax=Canna indica TaxID=4628 RepID=A0AAQ3JNH5_9LILI|nr:hypothetical protein Cni_G00766 [Canna indica]